MNFVANFVEILVQALELAIIADAILSFFVDPYHPVRKFTGAIVNPLLDPIRRVIPNVGMFDISPLVLLILVQILGGLLVNLLYQI